MVLIQEAAALLYLGSTRQTCRGDGLAVSPLFMDHHPSPISYVCLQKSPCLGSRHSVTACCLSILDSFTFFFFYAFTFLTNVFFVSAAAAAVCPFRAVWPRTVAAGGQRPEFPPADGKTRKRSEAFAGRIFEFLPGETQISV